MNNSINLYGIKIAHRGLFNNIDVPENSLLAFKRAIDKNIPIELDVRLTKDNILVVFHDANLKRLTGVDKPIKELTYEELKQIKLLDTNLVISMFNEVLSLVNGKVLIDIEIKVDDNVENICQILIDILKNYKGNYIVKSFNPKVVRWFMKNYPNVTRGLLIADNYKNKFYNYLFTSKWIMLYCKPNFLAVSKKILNTWKIQKLRKKYLLLVWTIENKEELLANKTLADTYICNNLPY